MYTVKESDGMFGVFKGDNLIEEFHFECEAWERVKELKRIDKYKKWGVPLNQDVTQAISEEQEEKLATEFKVTLIELWNRFHVFIMFVACVAVISGLVLFI